MGKSAELVDSVWGISTCRTTSPPDLVGMIESAYAQVSRRHICWWRFVDLIFVFYPHGVVPLAQGETLGTCHAEDAARQWVQPPG